MYHPYLYEVTCVHTDELIADARSARRSREAAGPSFFHRMATKLRHESITDVTPTASTRGVQTFTPNRPRWRVT